MIKKDFRIKNLVLGSLLTNCYLIFSKKETAVIDPGGDVGKILKETKDKNLKYIINTHYHPDHIFGNEEIKKKTGAKILIHKAEKNFIDFSPDKFLKEGDEIKIGDIVLKVFSTPGHTKGSICLLGSGFLFTGDTLFKDGIGRTDLSGGSETDMENSLSRLSKILKPGMTIYPGHGEIFTSKYLQKNNNKC